MRLYTMCWYDKQASSNSPTASVPNSNHVFLLRIEAAKSTHLSPLRFSLNRSWSLPRSLQLERERWTHAAIARLTRSRSKIAAGREMVRLVKVPIYWARHATQMIGRGSTRIIDTDNDFSPGTCRSLSLDTSTKSRGLSPLRSYKFSMP